VSASAARSFLQAYWRADLQSALAHCQPGAVIELARSLPIATPAPVADILPLIFNNVYPKFVGGRFDVTIDSTLEQNNRVLVEYTARGKLVARHAPRRDPGLAQALVCSARVRQGVEFDQHIHSAASFEVTRPC